MSTNSPARPTYRESIQPLFREKDRQSMLKAFDLWDYRSVVTHQNAILDRLAAGTMPCDGPWPEVNVDLLRAWIAVGSPE